MKIAFVTTQSLAGSTVIGRVVPLADELAKKHEVHVVVHKFSPPYEGRGGPAQRDGVVMHFVGQDPFTRTSSGKKRLKGIFLLIRLKWNAIFAALKLISLKPDIVIIEKSLPENVFATWLATRITHPKKIILDVDDFELTANVTTSWLQRAAIHWAERTGAKLADHIITVAPFLSDHFEQLTQGKKKITMIPTGLNQPANTPGESPAVTLTGESASPDYKIQNTKYNLLYAGSLTLSSGHRIDLLPEILAGVQKEIPEATLHIYGDGDDTTKLKGMFVKKNLSSSATWHGRFTQQELIPQLPQNCILIDSIDDAITNRSKSSFRVAMAALLGLPVISSNIGIRPYLVPDSLHEKFFAKPGDPKDYAKKILALINNPLSSPEQESLRARGAQFTWLQLGEKYEKIIAT